MTPHERASSQRERGSAVTHMILTINAGSSSLKFSLVEVTDESVAILRFGGGCQGCSSVDMTLKDGVEKTLIEKIPELKGVRDETDHSDRSSAYM